MDLGHSTGEMVVSILDNGWVESRTGKESTQQLQVKIEEAIGNKAKESNGYENAH